MSSGSIAIGFFSTTLRSSAVASFAASPRLSIRRNFSVPLTARARHNPINAARAVTRASASSMASSFSPEKARVPPAIELPVPPVSKVRVIITNLCDFA